MREVAERGKFKGVQDFVKGSLDAQGSLVLGKRGLLVQRHRVRD